MLPCQAGPAAAAPVPGRARPHPPRPLRPRPGIRYLQTIQALGFEGADHKYGLVPAEAMGPATGVWLPEPGPKATQGRSPGSGWAPMSTPAPAASKLRACSLPGSAASRLMMDLTINGQVITGTWAEETNPAGYYQGSTCSPASSQRSSPLSATDADLKRRDGAGRRLMRLPGRASPPASSHSVQRSGRSPEYPLKDGRSVPSSPPRT